MTSPVSPARRSLLRTADLMHGRFARRLLLATAFVIAVVWTLLAFDVWRLREQRLEHAGEQAASLARAVEQRVTRTLRVTDQMLQVVREEIAMRRTWNDDEGLTWLLAGMTPNLDEILSVAFIAADGTSLAHSNPDIRSGINYSDSDFFRFHTASNDDRLYVERPIFGPASGQRIFTVSRAVHDDKGHLRGIVNATVRADSLAEEFAGLRIGPNGALGFHHLDSYRILARQPDHAATFGTPIDDGTLRAALDKAPAGIFVGAIARDNVERFFAYRKLDQLPLAVTVGVARKDVLAGLGADISGYVLIAAILSLGLAAGSLLLLRAHRRELELEQNLAEKEAMLKGFFDAAPAGMCTVDPEMRYQMVNPAMARMNGIPIEQYSGRRVDEVHPSLAGIFGPIHREILATGRNYRDFEISGRRTDDPASTGYWRTTFFPVSVAPGKVDAVGCFVVDVTAERLAEAALREREALLARMLELLPVGVWMADRSGRVIRGNPAGERIWNGARTVAVDGHVAYQGWQDDAPPIASAGTALARAVSTHETTLREMIDIECLDGTRKTILNSAVPMFDASGTFLGAIAVNEDITDLRRAEEEIRISHDFFEQTFEAAPVAKAIADPTGRYTKVNRAMCEFLGYSEHELLGMTFMDVTHPDDLTTNMMLRDDLFEGRLPSFQTEKRYLRKDGRVVWGLLAATTIHDRDGHPLYSIGQTLDIDRQKQAEQSLRESEARFRAIFDNANTGIAAADEHGVINYFNEAFQEMLGYPAEMLRRMNFADFTHPEDLAIELALVDEMREGQREHYRLEKRFLSKDGRVLWIDLSAAAIRDGNGRIRDIIGVLHDITESKKAELALTQSRQKLRALAAHQTRILEEDRKHIAREIHDELGQQLTALKMDVSLLRMQLGDNPALRERAEAMGQLVDRTMAVVRQVATNLRPAAIDLGLLPAIEWLAEDFAARWEIECVVECDESDIQVNDLLATTAFRVVQESLTNIARHAEASSVRISLRRDHRVLRVIVRDNGRGFDTAAVARKKAFGFFGMRERVLSVGGSATVESTPGAGTTVSITLPLRSESQQ
jgi:PAS domain S-box-containing protein